MTLRNLSYSFTPAGNYFVFDIDTGKTIETPHLKNASKAWMEWIRQRSLTNKGN